MTALTLTIRPWLDAAVCAKHDPEAFFPRENDLCGIAEAKAICNQCPVIADCLQDALTTGDDWGIRGGYTDEERREMQGKRPRHPKASNTQPRTHCVLAGHPMNDANTYVNRHGRRECKPCAQARKKRVRADTAAAQRVGGAG